ncbi:C-C motif chemokine 14 isoform X3 [Echinops telfairi]|uniref:C-C motif chemokine n=1 Tax=Echinops telfairi TaxID=9371 RepID=A0ABM0ITN7_ECHTE|nr:C-C motif chemokine 14 isoform X3 [Echinops telfairi]
MKVLKGSVSFLLIFLTLDATIQAKAESSSRGPYHPAECCLAYTTHPIPLSRLSGYYETSSQCSKPGIVFITKKGHAICANPSDAWVQRYVRNLEAS